MNGRGSSPYAQSAVIVCAIHHKPVQPFVAVSHLSSRRSVALMLFFTCDEFGLSHVFGDRLEADAADRLVHPELIDLMKERANGNFSDVRHVT